MTGTLRINRIAPLVLLALALVAGVASVRLASLFAPAFPLVDRPSDVIAPEGSTPAQLPARDASPASEPAMAPATETTPAYENSTPSPPGDGATSTATGSGTPASGYGTAPSRWSEWPNDIAPAYVPSQTTSKRPPPGNSP